MSANAYEGRHDPVSLAAAAYVARMPLLTSTDPEDAGNEAEASGEADDDD